LKRYTVTLLCHITGKEHEYFVSFPDEEALAMYFSGIGDRLVAVSDGWDWLAMLDIFSFEPRVPHYNRTGFVEPEYDYKNELGDFW